MSRKRGPSGLDVKRFTTETGPLTDASTMANALGKTRVEDRFDLDILVELVGYQLHRAEIDSYRQFITLFGKNRTSPKQFSALVLVAANLDLSQADLGNILGIDRATTTVMIDALEKRDLLSRQRSKVDRRKYVLRLTESGKKSLQLMKQLVRKHDEQLTFGLTSQERNTLRSLLKRIRSSDDPF